MHKYEHLLPPEFKSGNDIPVPQSTIKRERMLEIISHILDAKMDTTKKTIDIAMASLKAGSDNALNSFDESGQSFHNGRYIAYRNAEMIVKNAIEEIDKPCNSN